MNKKCNLLPLFLCLVFASCEMEVLVKLKFSQFSKFSESSSGDPLSAWGEIHFEVSSSEECNKKKSEFLTVLSGHFKEIKDRGCHKRDIKTYFHAEVKIPIYKASNPNTELTVEDLVGLVILKTEKGYKLGLSLSATELELLNSKITDKYFSIVNPKDISVEIRILNDSGTEVKWTGKSIYMDEKPYPYEEKFILKKGEKVKIKVSSILRDFIFSNGLNYFAEFETPEKKSENL